MKAHSTLFLKVLTGLLMILVVGCRKETPRVEPTITVSQISEITPVSAKAGAEVISDGGSKVTSRGVCWSSTNSAPTILDNKTTDGTGLGVFTSSITELIPGVTYYVRAYATNSVGTTYQGLTSFKTPGITAALTTIDPTNITSISVSSGGNIPSDGGSPVMARGVCWSTNQNPTISDSKTTDGTGTGIFTSTITGLIPGSTYYIRAYATNGMGTAYGNQLTATSILPILYTTSGLTITPTTASSGGNITRDNGAPVTDRGVCWGTSMNPTVTNSKTTDGAGLGSFKSSITGLVPGVTYFIRSYATSNIGTFYGNQVTLSQPDLKPFSMKALNYSGWFKSDWSVESDNDKAIAFLINLGANTIVLDWMVQFAKDGNLSTDPYAFHVDWANINSVISKATKAGLKVILKPHVIDESGNGQNRNLTNTNPNVFIAENFFPAWKNYLKTMCTKLTMNNIYAICIGTELNMIDTRNRTDWIDLISNLRGLFNGPLTYDSMFLQYKELMDLEDVVFWDQLDFISCSFYVKLTMNDNETVENLIKLMRNNTNFTHPDAIGYLKTIHDQYNKSICVIEGGGFQSQNGTLWNIWNEVTATSVENQSTQANGFDAYLCSLSLFQEDWLIGVSLWDLQSRYVSPWVDSNYFKDSGFYNKSAAEIVKKWFHL